MNKKLSYRGETARQLRSMYFQAVELIVQFTEQHAVKPGLAEDKVRR